MYSWYRFNSRIDIMFPKHPTTSEIYTLSLHDALPISAKRATTLRHPCPVGPTARTLSEWELKMCALSGRLGKGRSEEHTSELQSHSDLVCRLLLEKKKNRG